MFSLIITIISIALVAALALATLYYGGDAFNQGSAQAESSRLQNQAQQLQAADLLFRTTMGRAPTGLPELVSTKFLSTIPVAQATAISAAMAAGDVWKMPTPSQAVFVADGIAPEVCRKFNEVAYGADGVLVLARDSVTAQCYGSGSSLKVISARTTSALGASAAADTPDLPSADLTSAAVPTFVESTEWAHSPTKVAAAPVVPAYQLKIVDAIGSTSASGGATAFFTTTPLGSFAKGPFTVTGVTVEAGGADRTVARIDPADVTGQPTCAAGLLMTTGTQCRILVTFDTAGLATSSWTSVDMRINGTDATGAPAYIMVYGQMNIMR